MIGASVISTSSFSEYTETRITNNTFSDHYPQINDMGDIVWQRYEGSDDEIIYAKPDTEMRIRNFVTSRV